MEVTQHSALSEQVGGNHYKDMPYQPINLISQLDLDFFQGNVVKYVSRYKLKDGVRDLEKAKHYCKMAIDLNAKRIPDGMYLSDAMDDGWEYVRKNKLDPEVFQILMDVVRVRWEDASQVIDELIEKYKAGRNGRLFKEKVVRTQKEQQKQDR